ncbi:hypothetical protein [Mesorhizobium huakuii]|uniref:Uncharacterized protein n=1 Tax=Mesorhizobium huakuii TaxID=28104 RepID=A0A7G6T4R9_9HYPH|nr:hypothetical protein [Mesorhizobium huakuii]QND61751.1 hypothetical protein HB778_36450 [Mesorhizobium huakuii]
MLKKGSYLDRAVNALKSNSSLAFAHCATLMIGDCGGFTSSAYPLTEALVAAKHHVSSSIVFRRNDAVAFGGFDPKVVKWTDWSFGASLLSYRIGNDQANKIVYFSGPYYLYRTYTDPHRLSQQPISESEMVRVTVEICRPLFDKYYPDVNEGDIAEAVMAKKPTLLDCLTHIAKSDLIRARQFIRDRDLHCLTGTRSVALAP